MFPAPSTPNAQLALDTLLHKPTRGIPTWLVHLMEHGHIERLAGAAPGDYLRSPEQTYMTGQRAAGVCMIDQRLWDNPLSMGAHGYEGTQRGATTGAEQSVRDGIVIDSADAVARHLQEVAFPRLQREAADFDEDARVRELLAAEISEQARIGPAILKCGYGFTPFPCLGYGDYGYIPYFVAYGRYPELMERHFALQADLAVLHNRAAARVCTEGGLPRFYRLDHDMADSRGTLVNVKSLDRLWFPHFARSIEPLVRAGLRLIWHCDGNLMQMVPRLIAVGVGGFQGFQYEDGMDYERICALRTRDGGPLTIFGGVSVTRTLPFGTPEDVRHELRWLADNGPRTGLFLGCSSSVTPGVPWENIAVLVEGLNYYREQGRA